MATRSSTRSRAVASASSTPAPLPRPPAIAQPTSATSPQLAELRRQWKWAAVSQFLYTFAQLVNLEDVTLVDVENDLVNSTMVVIPRLMQRLLVTLTQDRRTTVDNWQTALRRQYSKRDPTANPIGVEPIMSRNSRAATVDPEVKSEQQDFGVGDDTNNPGPEGRQQSDRARSPDSTGDDNGGGDHETRTNDVNGDEPPVVSKEILTDEKDDEFDNNGADPMRDWVDLSILEKLESLHAVIEWHFQNPTRLRHTMRSDDENALWRIEPIGYDAKHNAYWLIGSDRLWIQRVVPKPQRKPVKRKATSSADNRKAKAPRIEEVKGSRNNSRDVSPRAGGKPNPQIRKSDRAPSTSRRGSRRPAEVEEAEVLSSPAGGRSRAAKTQANVKLDLQAKQLAAAKAEIESFNRRSTARSSPFKSTSRPVLGTRASRRLRGDDEDDEWQQIPDEWMPPSEDEKSKSSGTQRKDAPTRTIARNKAPPRPPKQPALEDSEDVTWDSDNESELTELSELTDDPEETEPVNLPLTPAEDTAETKTDLEEAQSPAETLLPRGFVEWETLCVSLEEWESIASRFEKATHYLEKALHKFLVQEVVPYVTETLREIERQRMKEESLMSRKRSSRIAIKETEKESARMAAEQQAEEEEKMARMRRLEARTRREEEDRIQREIAREQRRKEREEREFARTRRLESKSDDDDVLPSKTQPSEQSIPNKSHSLSTPTSTKPPRRRTTKKADRKNTSNDEWELDCEVCGSRGINKDDGVPLMSCGKCNKWQHITCHDAIDKKAGRKLRDWNTVDFLCKGCTLSQNGHSDRRRPGQTVHAKVAPNINGHRPGNSAIAPMPRHGMLGYTNGSTPSGLNDGTTFPYHHPTSGPSGFVGFAHYQPEQRGFSPHPSNFQGQHQLQPRGTTHPSLPSRMPVELTHQTAWEPRVQTHGTPQINGQSSFPAPPFAPLSDMQYGTHTGPPSNYQPYSTVSNGLVPRQPTQGGQYSHPYSLQPQQGSYNSSYYSQT